MSPPSPTPASASSFTPRRPSTRRMLTRMLLAPPSPQRLVLLIAFSLVVLYVLMTPGAWDQMAGFFTSDSEAALLDRYRSVARRQIQWMHDDWSGGGGVMSGVNDVNGTLERCRNTVQGASAVADDRGFVCTRAEVDSSGCCASASTRTRFVCDACGGQEGRAPIGAAVEGGSTATESGGSICCAEFEHCVSCCMRPDQKETLLRVLDTTRGHRLRAILSARDQFELCSSLCRTSSLSVRHENKYKNAAAKHCFVHAES